MYLRITAKDLVDGDTYIVNVSNYKGSIYLDEDLGTVAFLNTIRCTGDLIAGKGTSIESINIEVGGSLQVGDGIHAGGRILAGNSIQAGCDIQAGWGIEAGNSIKAGWGIESGEGIQAGGSIESGEGIQAGLAITAKGTIEVKQRILAGTLSGRELSSEEMNITCSKLLSGKIILGNLVEV